MQQIICAPVRVWVYNFVHQEANRRGEHTCCGGFQSPAKAPDEDMGAIFSNGRDAAVHQHPQSVGRAIGSVLVDPCYGDAVGSASRRPWVADSTTSLRRRGARRRWPNYGCRGRTARRRRSGSRRRRPPRGFPRPSGHRRLALRWGQRWTQAEGRCILQIARGSPIHGTRYGWESGAVTGLPVNLCYYDACDVQGSCRGRLSTTAWVRAGG